MSACAIRTIRQRYFIPRHRAPELAEVADMVELNLDSEPVRPTEFRLYSERVIHGEIYKARPEVNAVVHHHAHAVLPFAISGTELVPVFHLGAVIGQVPFWDQRDEFGDTNMLVVKPEEGASLARALGPHWTVLMRRHGATVAGTSLRELTFRTVFGCDNAKLHSQAIAHGHVDSLSPGEAKLTSAHQLRPPSMGRAWDYWVRQVEKAGLMPAQRAAPLNAPRRSRRRKVRQRPRRKSAGSAPPSPRSLWPPARRRLCRTIEQHQDARPFSQEETSMADMQSPRLPKLSEDTLTADQRALAQSIASGPRGQFKMSGPFAIYLHSPTFGELAQKLGGHLRFKTSVSPRLSEFAILCTAQQWKAQYEWAMHAPMAEKAGVKPETIAAIQAGRAPKKAPKDEMAIYDFVKELYAKRRVGTPTYNRVKKILGDAGVVELVGILGYYAMVSMTLNTFKAPLPQGMKARFKEGK